MDSRTYDETNEVWPYFVLTLALVVLVPLTVRQLSALRAPKAPLASTDASHQSFRRRVQREQQTHSSQLWIVVIGWALFAYAVRVLQNQPVSPQDAATVWDPYAILRISTSATAKEIRTAYRKLSLEFHPDKVRDIAESTKEAIEAAYVDITKAYRALTDEDTRENFRLFGHPDGPQPVLHGIALPAFLFNPTSAVLCTALYLVGFGLGIPLVVGLWWSRSQRRTRRGMLQTTAAQFCELLVKEQAHFIGRERLLREILSCPDIVASVPIKTAAPEGTAEAMEEAIKARRKMLDDFLSRGQPSSHEQLLLVTEVARLALGLHAIGAQFKSFLLCQRVIELHRSIVQAVPLDNQVYGEYLQLRDADLKAFVANPNPELVTKAVASARNEIPRLVLLRAQFRVRGEEKVTVNSQVHLELKLMVVPIGDTPPEITEQELNAVSADTEPNRPVDVLNRLRAPVLPSAVTPRYPLPVSTGWFVYIYGLRDNRLIEDPYEITHLDLQNLKLTKEQPAAGKDCVIGTLYVPISSASPPQPASLTLKVAVLNTTYYGTDIRSVVNMQVVEAAPLPLAEEDETPEEDDEEEEEGLSDLDTDTEEEAEIETNGGINGETKDEDKAKDENKADEKK